MSEHQPVEPQAVCCAANRGDIATDREREQPEGSRGGRSTPPQVEPRDADRASHEERALAERVTIPAGAYWMGTDTPGFPEDGEGPRRRVRLDAFALDRCAVTNLRFHDFVQDTGYVTEAERYGWSFVFFAFVSTQATVGASPAGTPWWRQTYGADWRHPFGPGSDLAERWDHPVVHVSWRDARAFATWSSGRLPSEAEWESAGRGGRHDTTFPWGDSLEEGGAHHANVWQGTFPTWNAAGDGYVGTAPVDAFEPNRYGLYNMVGNVWEWCQDAFRASHDGRPASNPVVMAENSARVMKGGSYLCHESYCHRYRLAARTRSNEEDGSGNVGFRVAYDLAP